MTTQEAAQSPLTLLNPKGLYDPAPNSYSHVASVVAGARIVFVAGQGGENEQEELQPDFRAQVRQAFANLRIALEGAGASMNDIAKFTVLIVDHDEDKLGVFGEELERAMPGLMKPACTLIPVPRLALDDMLFEVEAVAVLPAWA
jgi:enamine deaminase RidA (YjgF/YER057c/UK114 family)